MEKSYKIPLSDGSILAITVGGDRDITISADCPIAILPLAVNRLKLFKLVWDAQLSRDTSENPGYSQ